MRLKRLRGSSRTDSRERELEDHADLLEHEVRRLERDCREAREKVEQLEKRLEAHDHPVAQRLGEPSFFHRLEALKRERRHAREDHGLLHPVIEFDPKIAGRQLAERCGIPVPALLGGPVPIAELEEPSRDAFVVKPNIASTMRGVYPVARTSEGLRSLLDDQPLTWESLIEGLVLAHTRTPRSDGTALIEEMIPGPSIASLPVDWKLYCIGARVELVLARSVVGRRRQDARFRFFDRDFTDLGPIRHPENVDASLSPHHPGELVRAAETIAGQLPGPFVRVDLFDQPAGVVFGEITPYPGGQQLHTPEIDRALGVAWERAEAARLVRELRPTPDTP